MNALQIIYILNLNICENSFPSDDDDEEEDENNSWKMIHNQCWWCIASKQSDWFQGRSCHRRGQGLGWELHHLRVPVGREIPMPKRVIGWSRWFFSLKGAKGLFLKGYLILRDGIYVHMYLYTVYIYTYIFVAYTPMYIFIVYIYHIGIYIYIFFFYVHDIWCFFIFHFSILIGCTFL